MTKEHLRNDIIENRVASISSNEINRKITEEYNKYLASEPVANELFDSQILDDIPLFAADDVATYVYNLPRPTDFSDVVSSMAPPFDKLFIEFQNVPCPNNEDFYAWGVLITAVSDPNAIEDNNDIGETGSNRKPRWLLYLSLILEREKGKPFGPVVKYVLALADDGTWFRDDDGHCHWHARITQMGNSAMPGDLAQELKDYYAQFCFPALLTISFLHCRNIEIRPSIPSEKQIRSYRKKPW